MLHNCPTCGHTFITAESYASHQVPTTDGRVKIIPFPSGSFRTARWFMEFPEGPGGQGFVTTAPLKARCLSEDEMNAIGIHFWGCKDNNEASEDKPISYPARAVSSERICA